MELQAADPQQDWASYTLLLPVVAVGNVAQLAADLVIATLQLQRAGTLYHDALLPCIGAAAYSHAPGLSSGLELYACPQRRLAVLQQRAPAAPGLHAELAAATADWVAAAGFKQVGREGAPPGPAGKWWRGGKSVRRQGAHQTQPTKAEIRLCS